MSKENKEQQYPSVDLAYKFAVDSYDIALKRLDMMDTRIQTLLAFATTVSLAVSTALVGKGAKFASAGLAPAAAAYVLGVVVGFYARLTGDVIVLNPKHLFDQWLHYSEWEFKKNFIYYAGENFEHNAEQINRKGRLALLASILFLLETGLLAIWAVHSGF
ncbi:MAG TPA: hypothetical protein VF538_14710 [Pyrinomonadaceae bacterium]|jgi:hypothetical protein